MFEYQNLSVGVDLCVYPNIGINKNRFKDKKIHRKNSLRLKHYDYSQNGSYFITICTQNREYLFGEIVDDIMVLNQAGEMIEKWYDELTNKFSGIELPNMVIMPNHIHFILTIIDNPVGVDLCVYPNIGIDKIVQWFKTMTTNEYIRGVKSQKFPPFNKRIWQRNYHEHIIRNEQSFLEIQEYIVNNPKKWKEDMLYKCLNNKTYL